MAWEEPSRSLFTMVKPGRPLIAIDRIPASTTHFDPLRTPEDVPQHAPLYAAHVDHPYHFTPFDHAHDATGFPDVEDADWAMGILSPPSPSRRNSLELESFPGDPYDDMDIDEEPPTLSPPSPSRRSMALLPDADRDGSTFGSMDCPQLSPPSPIHRNTALPSLEPELDTTQGLFIEDHPQPRSPRLLNDTHSLFFDDPLPYTGFPSTPPTSRLQAEYRALLSLRERTVCTEHTSRARTIALRGRERELGRAVAKLRDGYPDFHSPAQPSTSASLPNSVSSVVSSDIVAAGTPDPSISSNSDAFNTPQSLSTQTLPSIPMPPSTLQAYHTLATRVMLERTDEKRRRKKDKQRLKELRVVLGVGVEALLGLEGAGCTVDVGLNTASCSAEKTASDAPGLGLEVSSDGGVPSDLGIAYSSPGALRVAPRACEGMLPPDPHVDSNPGLGLGWVHSPAPAFGGLDGEFASCARGASDLVLRRGLSARMPPDEQNICLDSGVSPAGASPALCPVSGSSLESSLDTQPSLVGSSLGLGLVLPYEQLSNLGLDLGLTVRPAALADTAKEHAITDCAHNMQDRVFAFAHLSDTPPSSAASPISAAGGLVERTHAMRRLVARMTMRRRDLGRRSLIEAGNMSGLEGAGLAPGGARDLRPHSGKGRSRLSTVVSVAEEEE